MLRLLVVVAVSMGLSGCARYLWCRGGGGVEGGECVDPKKPHSYDFKRDRYECKREAAGTRRQSNTSDAASAVGSMINDVAVQNTFEECMDLRGWTRYRQ